MRVPAVFGLMVLLVLGITVLASPGQADVVHDAQSGTKMMQPRGGSLGMDFDTLQAVWSPGAVVDGGPTESRDAGTFAMIPIPASVLLLGSGLVGLGLIGWRRRS